MIVTGYKTTADFYEAQLAIQKHTNLSAGDVKTIMKNIRQGDAVKLPDDFVLREDLKELDFLLT
jgi:hypothetical protein